MSINSAMLAGISGLSANTAALAAISDNIANVNTTGYKRSEVEFQQMVSGRAQAGAYNGGGVASSPRQFVSQQGNLQRSTQATDLGIAGDGFFVVTQKPSDLTAIDSRSFTRVGNFTVDDAGYLRNGSGLYLQGWPVDNTGEIAYDPTDLSALDSINVASISGSAQPTTLVSMSANLKSSTTISAAGMTSPGSPTPVANQYNAATKNMAMYAVNNTTGVQPDFEMQIPVSDSKGGRRTLTISVLRSDVPNTWFAEVRGLPSEMSPTGNPNGIISSGLLKFNTDGSLDMANSTLFGAAGATSLTIGASAAASGSRWATDIGIAAQTITFDLSNNFRQNDSVSQVTDTTTNGTAFGNRISVEVDDKGFVTAIFDNGTTRKLAQIALATFTNPDGLAASSGGIYNSSLQSGAYNLKIAGLGGAGKVAPSQLESSNVDLSKEFTGLITTQRAYSASSKIITTADQMLDELINIKR
jgi:flagellar hook protein FlgE